MVLKTKRVGIISGLLVLMFILVASASAQPPTPPAPPTLSNLTITPPEIERGDNVTIGFDIENIDSQSFTYIVNMHIENVNDPPPTWPPYNVTLTIYVELEAYESKTVSHTITLDKVGDFNVTVDGLTGSFKVKSPEPPLRPAEFEISDLTITPLEVEPGEEVEISLFVKNIGEQQGSYMLSVLIENGQIFSWVSWIDLDGGTNETVRFRFKPEAEGNYKVDVNELICNFIVKAVPKPAEFTVSDLSQFISIEEGADITIFVNVSNVGDVEGTHQVDLKLDGDVVYSINVTLPSGATEEVPLWIEGGLTVGTYQVEVEGLTDSFTVEPKPSFWDEIPGFPYESIIIGLIAVIIILRTRNC